MRIRLKTLSSLLWLLPALAVLIFTTARVLSFIHIFGTHAGILITQAEIAASFAERNTTSTTSTTSTTTTTTTTTTTITTTTTTTTNANNTNNTSSPPLLPDQQIPKIIHQIFHNWKHPGHDGEDALPADWAAARKSCVDLHPGWDVKLWTEADSRAFIAREYPTFVGTYDGYRFPVQRTDALRYFLLMHFGGIYMDLDNGCLANLEPLLCYPTLVADGAQGALSNNILASRPHHPFWTLLTLSLRRYDYDYVLPYITISYASGQWFETDVWELYHSLLPSAEDDNDKNNDINNNKLYRIKLDGREAHTWTFFTAGRGGTWNNWDNRFFGWVGQHVLLVVVSALALFALAARGTARCLRRLSRRRGGGAKYCLRHRNEQDTELEKDNDRL